MLTVYRKRTVLCFTADSAVSNLHRYTLGIKREGIDKVGTTMPHGNERVYRGGTYDSPGTKRTVADAANAAGERRTSAEGARQVAN